MVFLGPAWSPESSPVSSVWATGRWRLDRSAGWVTDFLLLSTKKNHKWTVKRLLMFLRMVFVHSDISLTDPDNTRDCGETMVSYSLSRSLHQSGLGSVASHHRRKWCQYSNRRHTWTDSLNSDLYTLWAQKGTPCTVTTKNKLLIIKKKRNLASSTPVSVSKGCTS